MLTSGSPELVGFRSHHSFGAMVLTTTKSVPYSHFVSAANMHFVPDLAQSAFNLLAMIAMLAASKKYNFTQRQNYLQPVFGNGAMGKKITTAWLTTTSNCK